MLRSLEGLEFHKGHTNGLEIQMSTQGKMIEVPFHFQALQLENGIQGSKDMIVLSSDTA